MPIVKKEVLSPELPGTIDEDHRRFYNEILDELATLRREAASILTFYSTGWLENEIDGASTPDWTNVHLGDDPTQDSNVQHNLNANLSDLLIKVLISTDGTDDNSFEIRYAIIDSGASNRLGITIFQVDENTITIQTGTQGISYNRNSDGAVIVIDTEAWYYKIEVYKLK